MEPFVTAGIVAGAIEIAKFTGNELAKYLLKKEGFDKIFSESTLEIELTRIINETMFDYEKAYPIKNINGQNPFYQSQVIVSELLKFRVMHKEDYDVNVLLNALEKEPNVIPPTNEELNKFYEIFVNKINSDEVLKKIEISKTFQEEVFVISRKVDSLQRNIENVIKNLSSDLELQWKDRIDSYVVSLNQFKPETALRLLQALEDSFSISSKKPTEEFLSLIEYQKGICYNLLLNDVESNKSFINAYKRNPNDKVFKEQAALSYYKLKEFEKSIKLAEDILQTDEFNSIAYAIKILKTDENQIENEYINTPQFVKEDILFKRLIYSNLQKEKRYKELEILINNSLIPPLSAYEKLPTNINTYSVNSFWINLMVAEYFKIYFFNFNEINKNNFEIIELLHELLSDIISKINHSELEKENYTLYFFLSYTNYIKTNDVKFAEEMLMYYEKGKYKNITYSTLCANTLQLAELNTKALTFIDSIPEKQDLTILFLKLFIFLKVRDLENYILAFKECVKSIKKIDKNNISNYLNALIVVYESNRLNEFTIEELSNKEYESDIFETAVFCIVKLLVDGKNEELIGKLNSIAPQLVNDRVITFIALTFFLLEQFEDAVNIYRTFLNYEIESEELNCYIISLNETKKYNSELILLLEKWRTQFSFNDNLLRIEADKKRQLMEWKQCIDICKYYFKSNPKDESFITLALISLSQINDDEAKKDIKELVGVIFSVNFKHLSHVKTISELLIRQGYNSEALELLYRYAKNPENSQLRLAYFLACSRTYSKENPIAKEYEFVIEDCYVKYLLNSQIHIVELTKESIKQSKFKDFVGHKVGDIVPLNRPVLDTVDNVTIIRIMDKYLSLHDEIMEEVHNNPYTDIPMQSIQFNGDDIESINKTFTELFGARGSVIEQENKTTIANYYNFALSFSEIIIRLFSNDYIGGYYNLAKQNNGINLLPLSVYNSMDISGKEFVLDYSSLLIFHQIAREHNLQFSNKFTISRFIVEGIKHKLQTLETEPKAELAISITKNGVVPIYVNEDEIKGNHFFLTNLLEWIDNNCIIKVSTKILDITATLEPDMREKPFMDYIVNNCLLVEDDNAVLITDDTLYLNSKLLPIDKICSSEFYFCNFIGNNHQGFHEFIKNKYRGITLTEKLIFNEFEKKLLSQTNYYNSCLENLSPYINPNNGEIAIGQIKAIARHTTLDIENKKQEIIEVFIHLFKGWINPNIIEQFKVVLLIDFKLSNIDPVFIINCLDEAFKLLN